MVSDNRERTFVKVKQSKIKQWEVNCKLLDSCNIYKGKKNRT